MNRVIRIEAIEPWRARAADWWVGLSPRERVLVGTLGALLAVVVLLYGILQPLQAARAQALADIRTYETLSARIRAAGALGPAGPPPRQGPPETIVTTSAASAGLTVTAQPIPGGVRATVAQSSYDASLNWMADLVRTSNLRATNVIVRESPTAGQVTTIVDFVA